ncbi:MAG: hypothetical protein AAGC67_13875 [Myxococcota bacterium]
MTKRSSRWQVLVLALLLAGCRTSLGTAPPPGGWANHAPTVVERVVDRGANQLLEVRQGQYVTWVRVPQVGARVGDYVLLGQGTAERNVEVAEIGERVPELVTIEHARAVDLATAQAASVGRIPEDAVGVAEAFAGLDALADREVVVHGIVTRVAGAIGWYWVHLRDASGDPALADLDLTVQTKDNPLEGQRVLYRGTLRKEVDLGFGYFYDALLEEAEYAQ